MRLRLKHRDLKGIETLESRRMLAADALSAPLTSAEATLLIASDTTGDGQISPADALQVINFLAVSGVDGGSADTPLSRLMDVNGEGGVTPRDALVVINRLATDGVDGVVRFDVERFISPETRGILDEAVCLLASDRARLQTYFETFNALRPEIGATTEEVIEVIDATVSLADETLVDPSPTAIASLQSLFQTIAADGEISSSDLTQLRSAADEVLRSTGASLASIEPCLDGLDAIASRGISPEALATIYDQTVDLLTNWDFDLPTDELTQTVNQLSELILSPNADFSEIGPAIRQAIDPEGALTAPNNTTLLRFVNAYRLAAMDGELDQDERNDIGEKMADVFTSMGMTMDAANDLVATIENVLGGLVL